MGWDANAVASELCAILSTGWWPILEDMPKKKDVYAIAKWACVEMVMFGNTTICDVVEAPKGLPVSWTPKQRH